MKKVLLITLALMVCASGAMADHMGVYADAQGNTCALTALAPFPTLNAAYLIHKFNSNGATAIQFKVVDTTGLLAASQVFPAAFLTLGTWNQDLSVAYGGCLNGDIAVGTLNFYLLAAPPVGCGASLTIDDAPTSPIPGEIATVECDFETVTSISGGKMWVGPDAGGCVGGPCDPLAAQENTWGGVKALYR
jgi:hypothetical protein